MRPLSGLPVALTAAVCTMALIAPVGAASATPTDPPAPEVGQGDPPPAADDDDGVNDLAPVATDASTDQDVRGDSATIDRDVPETSVQTFSLDLAPDTGAGASTDSDLYDSDLNDSDLDDSDLNDSDLNDSIVVDVDGLRVVGISSDVAQPGVVIGLRSDDGTGWSDWTELDLESAKDDPEARVGTDPIAVVGASRIEVTVLTGLPGTDGTDGDAEASLDVDVIDPGSSPDDATAAGLAAAPDAEEATSPESITTPPTIRSRAAWGADETQRRWRPEPGRVTGAVVHHTAGINNYTQAQVPAIIRGIYQYHANTLNWGDIGYNILVDRYGVAWEGRFGGLENPVIAAHALGANATTFGVGMLGNFEIAVPPQVAINQVSRVIGWKFSVHGITNAGRAIGVDGASIPRITGHRDVNATACPGRYMYSQLGSVRTMVEQYQRTNRPRTLGPLPTVRLSGADRSATSVAIGAWTPQPGNTVYIATSESYGDALAIGPVAARQRAGLLLVSRTQIPQSVRTELQRRKPSQIVVLGGAGAVSGPVLSQLRNFAPTVQRVSGEDRYETAQRIANAYYTPSNVNEVWIAPGANYADALAAAPGAARAGAPLLLSGPNGLTGPSAQALRTLRPSRVIVVGGTTPVPNSVLAEIRAVLPNVQPQRVSGANRYETAAAVARHAWPGGSTNVHFAQESAWPDAVTGAASAGAFNSPMLLVQQRCAPQATRAETNRLRPSRGFILGGTGVIAQGAEQRGC